MLDLRRETKRQRGAVWPGVMLAALLACSSCGSAADTTCAGLRARWNAIVRTPSVVRCTENADCAAAFSASCNGDILIDEGRGTAVNGKAYAATEGPALEEAYRRQMCSGPTFDVAPPVVACTAGMCQGTSRGCNVGWRDAGAGE